MMLLRELNFSLIIMKRLFYFTGYRLKVFHWKNRKLVGEVSFEPTESGLENFRNYLQQSINIPVKFLVDVIEEDFRIETVPHVGSKDRNAVVGRLIDRYYRSSQQYCFHEVVGREKSGRKDDRVLIGAMTNPMLIQPWLSIIDEYALPLSGIWSLPLISRLLLKKINAHKGITLLVSQQVNSNVRQSLFRDGQLLSSRQSIINQDFSDSDQIGEYAAPEVEKTLVFLRNQEFLGADEVVNLHIICNVRQLASIKEYFLSDDSQKVVIHSTESIVSNLKLGAVRGVFSDEIFSWLCISQPFSLSHYGKFSQFYCYFSRLASLTLYAASILVFVLGFLLMELNISSAIGHKEAISLLKKEKVEYQQVYRKKFKAFENIFKNAGVMSSAVVLASRIKRNARTSPLDFMIQLSRILSNKSLPVIQIDKIEWWAANTGEEKQRTATGNKSTKVNFTSKNAVVNRAIVKGRINVVQSNYRESIRQVNAILSALKENPSVIAVKAISMPVDFRSDSKFSSESGVDTRDKNKHTLSGVFSFSITMRASVNG